MGTISAPVAVSNKPTRNIANVARVKICQWGLMYLSSLLISRIVSYEISDQSVKGRVKNGCNNNRQLYLGTRDGVKAKHFVVLSSTICETFAFLALFAVNCFSGFLPQSTRRPAKCRKEFSKLGHHPFCGGDAVWE